MVRYSKKLKQKLNLFCEHPSTPTCPAIGCLVDSVLRRLRVERAFGALVIFRSRLVGLCAKVATMCGPSGETRTTLRICVTVVVVQMKLVTRGRYAVIAIIADDLAATMCWKRIQP